MVDTTSLASEIADAYANRRLISLPSSRNIGFDLAAGYAVEAELVKRRRAMGRQTVGLKVAFANKATWRVLELNTLVWAHIYDDTVHRANSNRASLSLAKMVSPKIEPEIVFTMKAPFDLAQGTPLDAAATDAAAVLEAVESIALGFEIVDCVYPDWKFQPPDLVAAYGLHAALIVGEPQPVDSSRIPALVDALPQFTVMLSRNGVLVEEGSGKNVLSSPALCLVELASAIATRSGAEPLDAGDLVSTGSLTESKPIAAAETWTATVAGIDLPALRVEFS